MLVTWNRVEIALAYVEKYVRALLSKKLQSYVANLVRARRESIQQTYVVALVVARLA